MFLLAGGGLQLCVHLHVFDLENIPLTCLKLVGYRPIVWVTFDMPSTVCVCVDKHRWDFSSATLKCITGVPPLNPSFGMSIVMVTIVDGALTLTYHG